MKPVKRFDFKGSGYLEVSEKGKYVSIRSYQNLAKENERLKEFASIKYANGLRAVLENINVDMIKTFAPEQVNEIFHKLYNGAKETSLENEVLKEDMRQIVEALLNYRDSKTLAQTIQCNNTIEKIIEKYTQTKVFPSDKSELDIETVTPKNCPGTIG